MAEINRYHRDIVVIGAGLTGLTTAFYLARKGRDVEIVEQQNRTGGQIHTCNEAGFTFESGPNTGVISYPEVAELFSDLGLGCEPEIAREASKQRLIWKGNRFHPLPSSLASAVSTPLFSLKDKFRILGEPFWSKGKNPDETIASLTSRRLGKSFLDYAVDPFISGVYAGNPSQLVTRFALPKLYQLEQSYGSFIKGAVAKARQPKTAREKLATKKVFSVHGGLNRLTEALERSIGSERITLNAQKVHVLTSDNGSWTVRFTDVSGKIQEILCNRVITTTGAYTLPALLPFIATEEMQKISNLHYAPVIQVSVGIRQLNGPSYQAFGGLVPSCEDKDVLGILFPSACFTDRAPEGGALYSFFIGGVRHEEYLQKDEEEIKALIRNTWHSMLKFPKGTLPDLIRVFRHKRAIPQYDIHCGERLPAIESLQRQYPGLILAGNIKGGIGMADRIRQAVDIASAL